jgi:hypothetical protein
MPASSPTRGSSLCSDAFSSREPPSTSLENALVFQLLLQPANESR